MGGIIGSGLSLPPAVHFCACIYNLNFVPSHVRTDNLYVDLMAGLSEPTSPTPPGITDVVVSQAKEAVESIKKGKSPSTRAPKVSNIDREARRKSPPPGRSSEAERGSQAGDAFHDGQRSLRARDFFWDDLLSYIASAILGLALVDLSVEFLAGSHLGVLCFTPTDFNRDQSAFVNDYCSRYLPVTRFYPLFTLVQGIVLYVPHYLWTSWFSSYFTFFFALAGTLDRHRQRNTGEYSSNNTTVVRRLESEFSGRYSMVMTYFMKLLAQVAAAIIFISLTSTVFNNFDEDIICPPNGTEDHPIFGRVDCSYARFSFLYVLQVVNVILLGFALVTAVGGIVLTFIRSYSDVLGYLMVANFMFESALQSSHFVLKLTNTGFCSGRSSVHVRNDLDFLLVKLFETDAGFGKLFKDIQVSIEESKKLEAAYKHLHILYSMGKERTRGENCPPVVSFICVNVH